MFGLAVPYLKENYKYQVVVPIKAINWLSIGSWTYEWPISDEENLLFPWVCFDFHMFPSHMRVVVLTPYLTRTNE